MELYVLNPKDYQGSIITSITVNDISEIETAKCHYSKRTLNELKSQYGDEIIAIEWDELYEKYDKPYKLSLQKPFKEITYDEWDDMLNCLPPMKWHDFATGLNVFFCSEATTGDLHGCYIKDRVNNKFYAALRSMFITDEQLLTDFNNK